MAIRRVARSRRPPVQPYRIDDVGRHVGAGCGRRPSLRPQAIDQSQDPREQPPWNRHLDKLKGDVPTVPDHLGTDLDQLLPQSGQRSVLYLCG